MNVDELVLWLVDNPGETSKLLQALDRVARNEDSYEYGLPMFNESLNAQMRCSVLQWMRTMSKEASKCQTT